MKKFKNWMTEKHVQVTTKINHFLNDQKGEGGPVNWVVMVFIGLVLAIGVYILFKGQIDSFVKQQIFGRMNQLQ